MWKKLNHDGKSFSLKKLNRSTTDIGNLKLPLFKFSEEDLKNTEMVLVAYNINCSSFQYELKFQDA
ncbi:MAG: hypothetical protein QXM00_12370 [Candidatus Bathyarchaeia archaeon]